VKLYRLGISPDESQGEGEDHDRWFASIVAAKRERAKLIREIPADEYKFGEDFAIDEVTIANLPPRALALAILNRKGWVSTRVHSVVEAYRPPPRSEEPS
jgi:hypothetical protein